MPKTAPTGRSSQTGHFAPKFNQPTKKYRKCACCRMPAKGRVCSLCLHGQCPSREEEFDCRAVRAVKVGTVFSMESVNLV